VAAVLFSAAVCLIDGVAPDAARRIACADDRPGIRDYRDTRPTIDALDSIRVLSADKAFELEDQIKKAYEKLAPTVVRIRTQENRNGPPADGEFGSGGAFSGVVIDSRGLILTCAHHGLAPGTVVTIEFYDGKRRPGRILGRTADPQPGQYAPDLGLALVDEGRDLMAARLSADEGFAAGQICLAVGYPATIRPGQPPLLRAGRLLPGAPDWPWLQTSTNNSPGDSGGPLFDLGGRVIAIASGGVLVSDYQPVARFHELRDRLEAGDVVVAQKPGARAARARPAQPSVFSPALDLEDRVLQVQRSLIHVLDGPHAVAAGLIVDPDGWAITKASLVGSRENWQCRLFYVVGGRVIVPGRVVATSPEHDVALMKLEIREWQIAPWSSKRPAVGKLVCSILGGSTGPIQFSVVGSEAEAEPAKLGDVPQIAISVKPKSDGGAPVVVSGDWNSAEFDQYRELIQPGDVITHLNGMPTPSFPEFGRVSDRLLYALKANGEVDYHHPAEGAFHGDWVSIGIRRGMENQTIRVPRIHSATAGGLSWHTNPLSLRRESFPRVFAHDQRLRPEQCGGPLVDLAGHVVGINIASADASRTLAIPADVVQGVIAELRKRLGE
jgi:serine protease Do